MGAPSSGATVQFPVQLIWDRKINPGKVFDLTLPLSRAAEAYRAPDERRAVHVLLDVGA